MACNPFRRPWARVRKAACGQASNAASFQQFELAPAAAGQQIPTSKAARRPQNPETPMRWSAGTRPGREEVMWPLFESSFDSQVIGLWRQQPIDKNSVSTLLLTRRPDLSMWERSKIPKTMEEKATREKLSRRYDLCDHTVVYTTTLITARDAKDTVSWS